MSLSAPSYLPQNDFVTATVMAHPITMRADAITEIATIIPMHTVTLVRIHHDHRQQITNLVIHRLSTATTLAPTIRSQFVDSIALLPSNPDPVPPTVSRSEFDTKITLQNLMRSTPNIVTTKHVVPMPIVVTDQPIISNAVITRCSITGRAMRRFKIAKKKWRPTFIESHSECGRSISGNPLPNTSTMWPRCLGA
jgi:hypothetical protein